MIKMLAQVYTGGRGDQAKLIRIAHVGGLRVRPRPLSRRVRAWSRRWGRHSAWGRGGPVAHTTWFDLRQLEHDSLRTAVDARATSGGRGVSNETPGERHRSCVTSRTASGLSGLL